MTIQMNKGYLVLIGGAEDRKHDKTILKEMVSLNNAKTAVIIPTASSYPDGLGQDYYYVFKEMGVENIFVFDIRQKYEVDKPEYLEIIEKADLIFFTGGDQVRLTEVFLNSQLINKIKQRFANGATIGGTSAGAAASCDPILYDGDDEGLIKGSIGCSEGFGFVQGITFDTHFDARARLARLTQFLCSGKSTKGIGLSEDTAIFIHPDNTFNVIGSGAVTVVDVENMDYCNFKSIDDKQLISVNGIKVGFLQSGSRFDLNKWKII